MLFITKSLSFPTSLLTKLLRTATVFMTIWIDVINAISSRSFCDYLQICFFNEGSTQILDSTFSEASYKQGKLANMHHCIKLSMYHFWLELLEKNLGWQRHRCVLLSIHWPLRKEMPQISPCCISCHRFVQAHRALRVRPFLWLSWWSWQHIPGLKFPVTPVVPVPKLGTSLDDVFGI